ncbi:MAG: hypothetical protein QOJ51_4952 [Acidobacteriaceae bacterium]|nr:hypothetical protein [Acidobacteriaceae bacterium]
MLFLERLSLCGERNIGRDTANTGADSNGETSRTLPRLTLKQDQQPARQTFGGFGQSQAGQRFARRKRRLRGIVQFLLSCRCGCTAVPVQTPIAHTTRRRGFSTAVSLAWIAATTHLWPHMTWQSNSIPTPLDLQQSLAKFLEFNQKGIRYVPDAQLTEAIEILRYVKGHQSAVRTGGRRQSHHRSFLRRSIWKGAP